MASEINSGGFLERRFKMIVSETPKRSNIRWLQAFVLLYAMAVLPFGVASAQEQTKESGAREPDVEYVPTPQHVVNLMLELVNVKKTDLLYDLGCGDGRIVITAAKKYGCKALGVDIDPARVRESLANVKAANLENLVTIEQKDIFELDLSEADVVTLYLLPELNVRLIPQLEMMKPGSRVVSYDFDMLGVEPDAVVTISDRLDGEYKIYLWRVPLNKVAPLSTVSTYVSHSVRFGEAGRFLAIAAAAAVLAGFFWCLR